MDVLRSLLSVLCLPLLGVGCSAELDPYTTDAESGSTHALVSVTRSQQIGGTKQAEAMAGFVQTPAETDPEKLLELVGLRPSYPAPLTCTKLRSEKASTVPLASMGSLEFLPVGQVSLQTSGGQTALAPRAFPGVTELVSGVVYTSRDRSASQLPAETTYRVTASELKDLNLELKAPAELSAITVGGIPLAQVQSVALSQPIDLTWAVGDEDDWVVVELTPNAAQDGIACTFRDERGAGTIPVFADRTRVAPGGTGRLTLHRVRSRAFQSEAIDLGEMRFDLSISRSLTFSL